MKLDEKNAKPSKDETTFGLFKHSTLWGISNRDHKANRPNTEYVFGKVD